jgi:ElaB/YqjD/DUF883 family membrane-anchored ribosome-binding protein
MKKKVSKSDKVTLETLDSKIDKLSDVIESLAISTAKGFESIEDRFNNIDSRFEVTEDKLDDLDKNIQATRREALNMGDKFVSYNTFDKLALRVAKLEKNKK